MHPLIQLGYVGDGDDYAKLRAAREREQLFRSHRPRENAFSVVEYAQKMLPTGCMGDSPLDSMDSCRPQDEPVIMSSYTEQLEHDAIGHFEDAVDDRRRHVEESGRENARPRRAIDAAVQRYHSTRTPFLHPLPGFSTRRRMLASMRCLRQQEVRPSIDRKILTCPLAHSSVLLGRSPRMSIW